jgi:hypothetical protein
MTDQSPAETLEQLRQLEQENGDLKTRLAIIRISEPISSSDAEKSNWSPSKRTSDVSAIDNPTPASLEADLTHYKVRISGLHHCIYYILIIYSF